MKYHETFEAWRGPAIADTYGNKPVLDWHGEPLFAELVVLRQWQARGWDGVWVDSFRRQFRNGHDGDHDLAADPTTFDG